MKLYLRFFSAFLALMFITLSVSSCKKRPETVITETDTYYSYTNVSYGKNERHYLDLVIPKGENVASGMILYIHGGGWIAGEKDGYANTLISNVEKGYISAAINYRYANGRRVTCEDILDDIEDALDEIKSICADKGLNVDKVMLTGGSAGGHLSLMYAYTRKNSAPITPVAVVSYSGPTDLTDENFYITQHSEDIKKMISKISGTKLLKKSIRECEDDLLDASPIHYVNADTVPTILCHGTKDDVVPYSNAVRLYDELRRSAVECELIIFEDSGHGLESDQQAADYADKRFYELAEKYLK